MKKIICILIIFLLVSFNCYSLDTKNLDKEMYDFFYNTTWKAQIITKDHNKFHIDKYQILMTDPNGEWFVINEFGLCRDIGCVFHVMEKAKEILMNRPGLNYKKLLWSWD